MKNKVNNIINCPAPCHPPLPFGISCGQHS